MVKLDARDDKIPVEPTFPLRDVMGQLATKDINSSSMDAVEEMTGKGRVWDCWYKMIWRTL